MPSGAGKGTAVPSAAHTSLLRAAQSPRPAVSSRRLRPLASPWPPARPGSAAHSLLQARVPVRPQEAPYRVRVHIPAPHHVAEVHKPVSPSGGRRLSPHVLYSFRLQGASLPGCALPPKAEGPRSASGRHADSVLEKLLRSGGRNWPAQWGGAVWEDSLSQTCPR